MAAILNALRALSGGGRPAAGRETTDVAERFRAEHREFAPELARVRSVADRLGELAPEDVRRSSKPFAGSSWSDCRSTRRKRRPPSTRWSPVSSGARTR